MLVPRLHKYSYMARHIVTLSMNEEDAKADYVHHIAEIKAHVPADKVMNKASSRARLISFASGVGMRAI